MAAAENPDCIFCRIVAGEAACFKVFEDEGNLGFLDIFPNTEAFSVIVSKEHYVSDFAKAPEPAVTGLLKAARRLADKITKAYDDVDRCAVVMEGMMIDHLHAKVIPLHQTAGERPNEGEKMTSRGGRFFEAYPGYVTTEIVDRMAEADVLEKVAARVNLQET